MLADVSSVTAMGASDLGETYVLFESIAVTLQILSVVFNGAIICTVWRKSLLQCPSNRFVFSLCLSHLFVSALSLTISFISPMFPDDSGLAQNDDIQESTATANCRYNPDEILSHLMLYIIFAIGICTSLTVALISIERWITIARPMKYKSIVTPRRSLGVIIVCWILSALIAALLPIMIFDKQTMVCGHFAIPTERLGLYFAAVFSVVTLLALCVMIVCYFNIFTIAKEKCQKVQIGHFTSPVSSISSDWPSSAYSSVEGHKWMHSTRIASSNSLLHWVLMANLGRHGQAHPLRAPYAVKSADRPQTTHHKPVSATASSATVYGLRGVTAPDLPLAQHYGPVPPPPNTPQPVRRRWKTFLQHNYNSPRKTIVTIGALIGSVVLTQIPLSAVLFTHLEDNSQSFYFCYSVLFSLSSLSNPILYGFLNRSIRIQLWKLLRIRSRANRRRNIRANGSFFAAKHLRNRKDSISSGDASFSPQNSRRICRTAVVGVTDLDVRNNNKANVNTSALGSNISTVCDSYVYNPPVDSANSTSIDRLIQDFHQHHQEEDVVSTRADNSQTCTSNNSSSIVRIRTDSQSQETQGIPTLSSTLLAPNTNDLQLEESPNLNSIQNELDLQSTFPRKTSQDSGADMAFSEDDEEEEDKHGMVHHNVSEAGGDFESIADPQSAALTLMISPTQEFLYQSQATDSVRLERVETAEMIEEGGVGEPNISSVHLDVHSFISAINDPGFINPELHEGVLHAILVCKEFRLLRFYDDESDEEDEDEDEVSSIDV